jgi:hypothetical protein
MPGLTADRVGMLILLLATVIGLWLGLAGPDISPVAPPIPPTPVPGAATSLFFGAAGGGVVA